MSERRRSEYFLLFLKNFLTIVVIISIVIVLIFLIQGWTINSEGNPEQTGLLQFRTNVAGATIQVNGDTLSEKTNTKIQVSPGEYDILFQKEGYLPWFKKAKVKSGKISWISYARLIPQNIKMENFFNIDNIKDVKFSDDHKSALVISETNEKKMKIYFIELADVPKIREIKYKEDIFLRDGVDLIDLSKNIASGINIQHLSINSSRAILRWHHDNKIEWIYLDARDIDRSENLSRKYPLNIDKIEPVRTDYMEFLALAEGNIFSIKIDEGTIGSSIISHIVDYEIHDGDHFVFTQKNPINNLYSVRIYKKTEKMAIIENDLSIQPKIEAVEYYDDKYIAISTADEIRLYRGTEWVNDKGLKKYKTIKLKSKIIDLASNPDSSLIQAISENGSEIYDIEDSILYDTKSPKLIWLDNKVAYVVMKEGVFIKDFDGGNEHKIFNFQSIFQFSLSDNSKYMYGFKEDPNTHKFKLVRAKMVI